MVLNHRIAVIGLGYVGLPLAVQLATAYDVTGFDVNSRRVQALLGGLDVTRGVSSERLASVKETLAITSDVLALKGNDIYIVAVPTPITKNKTPDLKPLESASVTVGSVIDRGAVVVFESTVYPGCTEDYCAPILERESGLNVNDGFTLGYSPERVNPGDTVHTLDKITKVVSGSTPETTALLEEVYGTVIEAGTYKASSIRVAEAAKVIENSQRDLNIAFVNELALMFAKMGIDTHDVLKAAGTKWNFLPFKPGLVGGHCIGVDPYYLTHKAQEVGHHPEIILAGRRLNDAMGAWVANDIIKLMNKRGLQVAAARVLILGITFKENCPDIRNTRVIDMVRELDEHGCTVDVCDPWAAPDEVRDELGIELLEEPPKAGEYDAVVLAVSHAELVEQNPRDLLREGGVAYDVKGVWPREFVDKRL